MKALGARDVAEAVVQAALVTLVTGLVEWVLDDLLDRNPRPPAGPKAEETHREHGSQSESQP